MKRRRGRFFRARRTGYVSSFGDLDGLSISSSPKRLELLPYMVSDLTRQPTGGNPLMKASAPKATLGLDLKYAPHPWTHVHRDRQSRFRTGGSRSRRRQPVGVRDVLQRAPAVLRRRVRQLQLRPFDDGNRVLHAAYRTIAAGARSADGDADLRRFAGADDDSRRRESDRTRGEVLDWRPSRGDARGARRVVNGAARYEQAGRTAHELLRRPRAARVRQSIVASASS